MLKYSQVVTYNSLQHILNIIKKTIVQTQIIYYSIYYQLLIFSFDNNDWLIFPNIKAIRANPQLVRQVCYVDMLYIIVRRRKFMRTYMIHDVAQGSSFYFLQKIGIYRKSLEFQTVLSIICLFFRNKNSQTLIKCFNEQLFLTYINFV